MHPRALSDCAEFLGVAQNDVMAMHDEADLLPALIARLGLALTAKPLDDARQKRFIEALSRGWGSKPFLSNELVGWAEQGATGTQREVFEAARLLCGLTAEADLMAQTLGCALRTLVPGKLRIAGTRRGSTLWQLRLRD